MIIYHNIQKIATGEGSSYTIGCVIGYTYSKNLIRR